MLGFSSSKVDNRKFISHSKEGGYNFTPESAIENFGYHGAQKQIS
jgi:hypothetical protein